MESARRGDQANHDLHPYNCITSIYTWPSTATSMTMTKFVRGKIKSICERIFTWNLIFFLMVLQHFQDMQTHTEDITTTGIFISTCSTSTVRGHPKISQFSQVYKAYTLGGGEGRGRGCPVAKHWWFPYIFDILANFFLIIFRAIVGVKKLFSEKVCFVHLWKPWHFWMALQLYSMEHVTTLFLLFPSQ